MHQGDYEALLRQLCASINAADVETLIGNKLINVDGLEIFLQHLDEIAPGTLFLRFAFDEPSLGKNQALQMRLLRKNFSLAFANLAVFSMHPEKDVVVLTSAMPITINTTGQELAVALLGASKMARQAWSEITIEEKGV
jgi:hypothetical protein